VALAQGFSGNMICSKCFMFVSGGLTGDCFRGSVKHYFLRLHLQSLEWSKPIARGRRSIHQGGLLLLAILFSERGKEFIHPALLQLSFGREPIPQPFPFLLAAGTDQRGGCFRSISALQFIIEGRSHLHEDTALLGVGTHPLRGGLVTSAHCNRSRHHNIFRRRFIKPEVHSTLQPTNM